MTLKQLDLALRSFCRRRPFRPFLIEFISGSFLKVLHPEMVRRNDHVPKQSDEYLLYVARFPDGGYRTFAADSVIQLLDTPITVPEPQQ